MKLRMLGYTLVRSRSLAEMNKKMNELIEELDYWTIAYGCNCGHSHCSRCKDVASAMEVANRADMELNK